MAFYAALIPPPGSGGAREQVEGAELLPEAFSWSAFLFTGLWLLYRRLWLGTLVFLLAWGGLLLLRAQFGLGSGSFLLAHLVLALLLGLEGHNLLLRKRQRQGWRLADVVEARDLPEAERRFFERALAAAPPPLAPPQPPAPPLRGPVPVIGLFPQAYGR